MCPLFLSIIKSALLKYYQEVLFFASTMELQKRVSHLRHFKIIDVILLRQRKPNHQHHCLKFHQVFFTQKTKSGKFSRYYYLSIWNKHSEDKVNKAANQDSRFRIFTVDIMKSKRFKKFEEKLIKKQAFLVSRSRDKIGTIENNCVHSIDGKPRGNVRRSENAKTER